MGAGPRPLRGIHALDDFEAAARRHLPRPIFGYVAGAAETGASNRDNRAAFDELRFLPRVLNNVAGRSQKKMLFGREWNAPFGIAPMGVSALTAHRGDLVLAESAARAGIPMIMSGSSLTRTCTSAAPPLTGGISASSSPDRSAVVACAYSRLTAIATGMESITSASPPTAPSSRPATPRPTTTSARGTS